MRRFLFILMLCLSMTLAASGTAFATNNDRPDLVLYGLETDFAYVDECPFVNDDDVDARDARCEAEEEADQEDPEDPFFFVADSFVLTEELYTNKKLERQVGTNRISCVQHFDFNVLCNGAVALKDGNIFWSTLIEFSEETPEDDLFAVVALTGGTGDYAGARGYAELYDTTEEDSDEITSRYEVYFDD